VRPTREGAVQVEILSIGRDLLRGRVTDRNSQTIAARLTERGARIARVTVVDDDPAAIADGLRDALSRNPNLLVTSGGLGPAPDDRTLAAVADVLGCPLMLHPGAKTMVEDAYQRMAKSRLTPSGGLNLARQKMCHIPIGAEPVPNEAGVAPGVICRLAGGTAVLCLPGRPDEARATFDAAMHLLKDIAPKGHLARREVESPTPDESELRSILEQLAEEFPDVWITSHAPDSRKKSAPFVITLEAVAATPELANTEVATAQRRLLAIAAGVR
jgi:molybdenum cofactor synthesis domain-containing protein